VGYGLVDGGSQDETGAIADAFAEDRPKDISGLGMNPTQI
jgi:glycosyltransferase involved in cell wall biosynthesis